MWSPLHGLKGKIDVTGEFTVRRRSREGRSYSAKVVLPLELKTGKDSHSIEHHAQVAIYSMFCQTRRKNGSRFLIFDSTYNLVQYYWQLYRISLQES